jgi:hypothetical protein
LEVQFEREKEINRMDRIKRESTTASSLFLYPAYPVHPVFNPLP